MRSIGTYITIGFGWILVVHVALFINSLLLIIVPVVVRLILVLSLHVLILVVVYCWLVLEIIIGLFIIVVINQSILVPTVVHALLSVLFEIAPGVLITLSFRLIVVLSMSIVWIWLLLFVISAIILESIFILLLVTPLIFIIVISLVLSTLRYIWWVGILMRPWFIGCEWVVMALVGRWWVQLVIVAAIILVEFLSLRILMVCRISSLIWLSLLIFWFLTHHIVHVVLPNLIRISLRYLILVWIVSFSGHNICWILSMRVYGSFWSLVKNRNWICLTLWFLLLVILIIILSPVLIPIESTVTLSIVVIIMIVIILIIIVVVFVVILAIIPVPVLPSIAVVHHVHLTLWRLVIRIIWVRVIPILVIGVPGILSRVIVLCRLVVHIRGLPIVVWLLGGWPRVIVWKSALILIGYLICWLAITILSTF